MESIGCRLNHGWRRHAPPAWLERWAPRPFTLPGGVTELVEMGEGPPLLLLPPLPGYKEAWIACAPLLARRFRVITADLRERFAGTPGWDALVEDVAAIAADRARAPALVAGHSLGGALAMRFAHRHPAAVRGLVLSSAFRRAASPRGGFGARYVEQPIVLAALRTLPEAGALRLAAALARRGRWVFDRECDAAVLGLMVSGIRTLSPALARSRLRLAFQHAFNDAAALRTPTLVVWGERDTPLARAEGAALAREIPNAAHAVSPGRGHLHPLSGAHWLASAITEWFDHLVAPRS